MTSNPRVAGSTPARRTTFRLNRCKHIALPRNSRIENLGRLGPARNGSRRSRVVQPASHACWPCSPHSSRGTASDLRTTDSVRKRNQPRTVHLEFHLIRSAPRGTAVLKTASQIHSKLRLPAHRRDLDALWHSPSLGDLSWNFRSDSSGVVFG